MTHIKTLKLKTQEGFSLKDVKTFPSYEWGEDGGIEAIILYNGVPVGRLFNDGNGGMADFTKLGTIDMVLLKKQTLICLKRLEPMYTKYVFLRNKTWKDIDADDYDALVACIVDNYAIGHRGVI